MWSPDGPTATVAARQGWTVDGPDPAGVEIKRGWWVAPQAVARDDAAAADLATLRVRLAARISGAAGDSLYMGTDPTQDFELRIPIRDNAATQGLATVRPRVTVIDSGIAAGAALLGVAGRFADGVAGDLAVAKAATPARDNSASSDRLTALRAKQYARDAGSVGDSATATFSAVSATTATITATGTYTIPVWCRYIDVVLLGAGGGGAGGNSWGADGKGGSAGQWVAITLERGVDIPWTTVSFAVTIGTGGTAGSRGNGSGGAGTNTIAAIPGASQAATGGSGGSGTNAVGSTDYYGASPGSMAWQGRNYSGGAQVGKSTNGNPPGGGGGGGAGGVFGRDRAGGTGARGQAWITARQ